MTFWEIATPVWIAMGLAFWWLMATGHPPAERPSIETAWEEDDYEGDARG